MSERARVLVIGATGATGRLVVEQALGEGYHVTALVRDPSKLAISYERLRLVAGDVLNHQDVDVAVARQDSVLILLSQPSLNAPSTVSSEGTNNVVQAIARSDLEWTIVRPPRLTDAPGSGGYRVITNGAGKVSQLPRADLAAFMIGQVADTHYARQAVVVGY